ncbi:MAG: hypothetical protein JW820_07200 [Spirochaetales bacterium]|nr:hypothetical protein [Spirochaetales bacterium]
MDDMNGPIRAGGGGRPSGGNSTLLRRLWGLVLLIGLLGVSALGAQPSGAVEITSARSVALGGLHAALADDVDTLFANPAGFRCAGPEMLLAEITAGVSGPIFDIASVMIAGAGSDPADLLATSAVQDLLENLYAAATLLGPLSFAYVGNGLGFGFFTRTRLDFTTVGTVPTIYTTLREDFDFSGGYALRIPLPESWNSSLDVGILIRANLSGTSSSSQDSLSFFENLSDPSALLFDGSFCIGMGVGADVGVRYSYKDAVAVGIVARDLYAPRVYLDYTSIDAFFGGTEVGARSTGLEPVDLSAGIMWAPSLGKLDRYLSGLKLMLDYSDILDFVAHPATSTNPVLHLGFGAELVLLEVLSVRGGFAQGLFSAGVGLQLSRFTLDLSVFGAELSSEPGLRPVFNMVLGLRFTL